MKAQDELEKILNDTDLECKEAVLECQEEELARLRSLSERVTASMDGEVVSRTRNTDPMGEVMKQIEAKEKEIEYTKAEIESLKAIHDRRIERLNSIVNNLRKPMHIKILRKRYFIGKGLDEIADEEGYCYRNICYIHGYALQAVEAALKNSKQ